MRIDNCEFGIITIDGEIYGDDLILTPTDIAVCPWRRVLGHEVHVRDMPEEIIELEPHLIVIGCGFDDRVEVYDEEFLVNSRFLCDIQAMSTPEAVEHYKTTWKACIEDGMMVIWGLHLTC